MNDCPNAEIRDQLPDLLHERLDASARAAVMAHVDGCATVARSSSCCGAFAEMLVARRPRVDVASIVAALPKPPVVQRPPVAAHASPPNVVALRPVARRRVWSDWRVAAAVVLFVAGGSSVVLLRQTPGARSRGDLPIEVIAARSRHRRRLLRRPTAATVPANDEQHAGVGDHAAPADSAETVASADTAQAERISAYPRHLADLDDGQLKALLDDIDRMQAVPITDPEPVAIKIDSRAPARSEDAVRENVAARLGRRRRIGILQCGRVAASRLVDAARRARGAPGRPGRRSGRAGGRAMHASNSLQQEQAAAGVNRPALERQIVRRSRRSMRRQLNLNDSQMQSLVARESPSSTCSDEICYATSARSRQNLKAAMADTVSPDQNRISQYLDQILQEPHRRADLLAAEQKELSSFLTPLQRAQYLVIKERVTARIQQAAEGGLGGGRRGGVPPLEP